MVFLNCSALENKVWDYLPLLLFPEDEIVDEDGDKLGGMGVLVFTLKILNLYVSNCWDSTLDQL